MNMPKILVVDDEPQINDFLRRGLTYKGFEVSAVLNGEEALNSARDFPPDLVVLDIMLPDMTGYEVCRRLRASGDRNLPILMLTARDALNDKISGLDCGADDYITKPFAFEELLARIRANLRRGEHPNPPHPKMEVGDPVIYPRNRGGRRAGRVGELNSRGVDLL